MTVRELAEKLDLKIYSAEDIADKKTICGCFVGDLMSLAMAKVEADNVWVTIQTNVNIVAVASLSDCACVVVAEGFCPDDTAMERANEQQVILLGSDLSVYEITKKLVESGI